GTGATGSTGAGSTDTGSTGTGSAATATASAAGTGSAHTGSGSTGTGSTAETSASAADTSADTTSAGTASTGGTTTAGSGSPDPGTTGDTTASTTSTGSTGTSAAGTGYSADTTGHDTTASTPGGGTGGQSTDPGSDPGSDPETGATGSPPDPRPRPERDKDRRNVDQRRADAVADLFEHVLRNGLDWLDRRLPDQHKRRPHIEVVVPFSTLLGLDDDPAELTGYGPIPADLARRIAADGTWRRLLTDPINGAVLEASTTRHDPGTLVTETLLARHPVCAWPGCNRTSRECDRDHGTPFARTGTTSLAGMAPYCEYHHVIKDTPAWGWTTTNHPDGSITLTTPTGHRYTTVPPARGPITQPPPTKPQPPADDPPPF
ncbi:uncharacterized protein DUF222, partial [Kribbella sp. VKM Ac-2527]